MMLIDAMDPINRCHYGFNENRLKTNNEQDTTILYGFIRHLCFLFETFPTITHLLIVFDAKGLTFRYFLFS